MNSGGLMNNTEIRVNNCSIHFKVAKRIGLSCSYTKDK